MSSSLQRSLAHCSALFNQLWIEFAVFYNMDRVSQLVSAFALRKTA